MIPASLDDLLARFWSEITARPQGPMAFRFFVQPAVAAFLALRDGIRDARNQRPAYFWALLFHSGRRRELLRHGWRSACGVFTMAVSLDLAYQVFVPADVAVMSPYMRRLTIFHAIVSYLFTFTILELLLDGFIASTP